MNPPVSSHHTPYDSHHPTRRPRPFAPTKTVGQTSLTGTGHDVCIPVHARQWTGLHHQLAPFSVPDRSAYTSRRAVTNGLWTENDMTKATPYFSNFFIGLSHTHMTENVEEVMD